MIQKFLSIIGRIPAFFRSVAGSGLMAFGLIIFLGGISAFPAKSSSDSICKEKGNGCIAYKQDGSNINWYVCADCLGLPWMLFICAIACEVFGFFANWVRMPLMLKGVPATSVLLFSLIVLSVEKLMEISLPARTGKKSSFHNGSDFSSAYSAVVTGAIFMCFSIVFRILLTFFDLSHPKKPQQAQE